jgi:hypothetical protein
LPRATCSVRVTSDEVDVTEVGEGIGLPVAVAALPVQLEGALVAGDRPTVVAEVLVDLAEAVPGAGLPVVVAQILAQGQRLFAEGERRAVVTGLAWYQPSALRTLAWPLRCPAARYRSSACWAWWSAALWRLCRSNIVARLTWVWTWPVHLRFGRHPIGAQALGQQLPPRQPRVGRGSAGGRCRWRPGR